MQALTAGAGLVLAAYAVLALAGVCFLGKWDSHRHGILAHPRAAQLATAPILQTASAAARGPWTTVTRIWLCQACYWTWPAADLFCGICGRSRAAASDGREIQALSEGR